MARPSRFPETATRLLLALGLGLAAGSSCTDAALENRPVRPPEDTDTTDTTDADVTDTTDTTDTSDIPDVPCTSDENCRDLLTGLGVCDDAICNAATGLCEVSRRDGCCATIADCPASGDPCIDNQCPVAGGQCVPVDTCASCLDDRECDERAPACTSGRCSEGLCVYTTLPTCCIDAADCDDADICTNATCENGQCIHRENAAAPGDGCCRTPPVLSTSFSPAPEFAAKANVSDAGWYIRTTNFTPSPPAALYLGNLNRFVNTSEEGPHSAEVRFELGQTRAGAIEVKFQLYLDLRETPEVDRFRVLLVSASGVERLVYSKAVATLGAWHPVKRSILVEDTGPWALVFTYDAVTVDAERRTGILVDDLQVRTACGGELCQDDGQCRSDDPCLIGACVGGECQFSPNPVCAQCQRDEQCEDGGSCTEDRCIAGSCVSFPVAGCCGSDRECNDNDGCTIDRCRVASGLCFYERDPSCGVCNPPGCEDNDPCTRDVCTPNGCINEFDPNLAGCGGECQSDAQCPQVDRCTVSFCDLNTQRCVARQIPDCCSSVGDCNDNRICTEDSCTADGRCIHQPRPGCCETSQQCNDNNGCTVDRCDTQTGQCVFTPSPDCCSDAGPCNDNNACTSDACIDGRCVFSPIQGCCSANSQCNDNNACTNDSCQNNRCVFTPNPNCCTTNDQCNDQNVCTSDSCVNGTCQRTPVPNCCNVANQCNDQNACTIDACTNNRCVYSPAPNCCTGDDQCNDNNVCTSDTCVNGTCQRTPVPNCCNVASQCNDQNACTIDACTNNRCAYTPAPGCCTTNAQCNDNNSCTTDTCTNGQCVITPIPGCCSNDAQCNDNNLCTADRCDLQNQACVQSPVPGCCTANTQCNDNDPCTNDACTNNRCVFTPNNAPGCNSGCTSDAQCEDGALCTANQCVAGQCRTLAILGCCQTAGDCNDNNACTNDFCFQGAGICFNNPRTCNDNNACTLDRCDAAQGCVFEPDPACVCQDEVLWSRAFIQGETPDVEIDGSGAGIQWRVDSVLAMSPTQALRYGKADGSDYDNGQRTFGRATGPSVDVSAAAGEVRLDFMVYVDIDRTPDSFRARVLWGNQNVIVWDHVELDTDLYGQWVPVSVTLPAAVIGQEIQVRFVFDSVDGTGNAGQGVAVDDIVLYSTCP